MAKQRLTGIAEIRPGPYNGEAMGITQLANPGRFLALAERALPWLWGLTAGLFAVGIYLAFFIAPPDYQQGNMVRVMFVHVPNAWLSMLAYAVMAVAALGTLVWRHPLADVTAKSIAPIGAAFTFLALVTGSLWGRPTWGTYWVWDARLTSELVLLLIYLAIIILWQAVEDHGRAARAAAILTLVGSVNLPIIHYSVIWWNTLHQGESVFRAGGSTIDPSMLWPLAVMTLATIAFFVATVFAGMRNEILRRRIRTLEMGAAAAAAAPVTGAVAEPRTAP
jgi:heme exporter protein C